MISQHFLNYHSFGILCLVSIPYNNPLKKNISVALQIILRDNVTMSKSNYKNGYPTSRIY